MQPQLFLIFVLLKTRGTEHSMKILLCYIIDCPEEYHSKEQLNETVLCFLRKKDTLYDTHKREATFAHTDIRVGKVTQNLSSTNISAT